MVKEKYETGRGGMGGWMRRKIIMVRWRVAASGFKERGLYFKIY